MKNNNRFKIYYSKLTSNFFALLLVTVVVWAFAFPLIKIGLEYLSFENLTIMRFFVVSIILIIILVIKGNSFSSVNRRDVIPIFLLGFFGVIIYHLGLNYGEQTVSAGAASLIIATIPIFVVIFATIFLKEMMQKIAIVGIVISLIGVVILTIFGKDSVNIEINYIYGALAVLVAALMGALYTVAGKKLLRRYTALSLTIYAMLLGNIGLIPFINSSLLKEISVMPIEGFLAVIFLGLFSTVIGYVFWFEMLNMKSASELSVYLYLIPVLTTLISFIVLGETVNIFFVIGGVMILAGVYIVNNGNRHKIS